MIQCNLRRPLFLTVVVLFLTASLFLDRGSSSLTVGILNHFLLNVASFLVGSPGLFLNRGSLSLDRGPLFLDPLSLLAVLVLRGVVWVLGNIGCAKDKGDQRLSHALTLRSFFWRRQNPSPFWGPPFVATLKERPNPPNPPGTAGCPRLPTKKGNNVEEHRLRPQTSILTSGLRGRCWITKMPSQTTFRNWGWKPLDLSLSPVHPICFNLLSIVPLVASSLT